MTAPADIYSVASGLPIYGGRAAPGGEEPPATETFDSVAFVDNGDVPWSAQNGKVLTVNLHGSSGQTSNGRIYTAQVSGYMALPGFTEFVFSLVPSWNGVFYTVILRPQDSWYVDGVRRESMHIGFELQDGKVHLTSERRYDAMIDWCDQNLTQYDLTKRILSGGSMGGWGSITYGMRRAAKFAAIYSDRPRWRYGYSVGNIAVATFSGLQSRAIASSPMLADEDGGGKYSDYIDAIEYVSNSANTLPWIGWCCGRQDGYATFDDQLAAVAALRATKRGFAFAWNDGNHSTGSIMGEITKSYPVGTFTRGKGYPLFTGHSLDQDPAVDLVGGINIGLSFRSVVETASVWSCEVTSVVGACTVDVEPISSVFNAAVAKQAVTIPAANTWVPVSFSA